MQATSDNTAYERADARTLTLEDVFMYVYASALTLGLVFMCPLVSERSIGCVNTSVREHVRVCKRASNSLRVNELYASMLEGTWIERANQVG